MQFLTSEFQTDSGEPCASKALGSWHERMCSHYFPLALWPGASPPFSRGPEEASHKTLSSSKFTAGGYHISFRLHFLKFLSPTDSLTVKVTAGDKNKRNHQRNPCAEFPYRSFQQEESKEKEKKMKVASLTFALQQNINKREKQMYAFPPLKYVPWYQKMECFIIVIDEKTNCSDIFCCEQFKIYKN